MPDEIQDASTASSPVPDATSAASSPAVTSPEQATPQQAGGPTAEEQTPFHLHPRWQEVQQEKQQLLAQNQQLMEMLRQGQQQQPQQQEDPYANLDPQAAQFYRNMDMRIERTAQKIAAQQVAVVSQQLDAGRRQLAAVTLQQFRSSNPDILPNSAEENQIAGLMIQYGLPLDIARNAVLGPRYEAQVKRGTQSPQAIAQKRQANMEQSAGIPSVNGTPGRKKSFRETAAEEFAKAGL